MDERYICHICGYPDLEIAPWGQDGGFCSFMICPCCAGEYGVDDFEEKMLHYYREDWQKRGLKWFQPEKMPEGWDSEEQKKNISLIPNRLLPFYLQKDKKIN